MNFKAFFARQIGIRLTDDLSGLVCTVRRGWFHRKADEFAVDSRPAQPLGPIDEYVISEPIPSQYRRPRNP